jgi:hypothetical protein
MADEEDPSDLFAIPDLWRPPTWLDHPSNDINGISDIINTHSPLFTLDAPGTAGLGVFGAPQGLINTGKVQVFNAPQDDGQVFFKLPLLLQELATQQSKPLHTEPEVEHQEIVSEPLTSSDDEDLWLSPDNDPAKPSRFRTWESFEQPDQGHSSPLFLSEAGPAAFDALLASRQAAAYIPDVLDAALYCACLLNVALGRSSVLFSWNAEKNSFVKTAPHLRISGLSLDSVEAVDALCLDCGNSARHLQAFADKSYSAAATPTRVALAGVVDRLVAVVRSELSNRSHDVRSILQLQAIVQPVHAILSYFKGLVKKLAQQKSDEGLLSCLFQEAQASEYRSELLREITRQVLRIVSKPWTGFVEEWVGLTAEGGISMTKKGPGKGFVRVADKMWIDDQGFELEEPDYFLDEDKLPAFIPEDMGQTMFETGRNLRFLREHHPGHPLSKPNVVSLAAPPKLEWEFEWDAISKLEGRVNQYRNAVSRAIEGRFQGRQRETTSPGTNKRKFGDIELEYFGKDEAQVQANFLASVHHLDQPLEDRKPQDGLTQLLQQHLYRTADASLDLGNLSPHWSLVPLLSFGPVIEAQSSLISQECMKLLFSAHHLRTHIDLLKQYFLLGNGLLCSRLTHALFDPNLSTAERRAGVALGSGTMGLRLGARRTWPPASSELRLALMGVLSECYEAPANTTTTANPSHNPLPGDLSFAVRDLTPHEIDRCINPDSLEALDFLRLSYKPPPALRAVIAPATLLKYDRVFKLLLRVLRMLYVADELFLYRAGKGGEGNSASSVRMCVEAGHFVRQVASYFFEGGVRERWRGFEVWLEGVEGECFSFSSSSGDGSGAVAGAGAEMEMCDDGGGSGGGGGGEGGELPMPKKKACSPDVVRERQERVLDDIMGVLFLRKRQAPVLALLEEIFGVVLRFVRGLRVGWGEQAGTGETPEELYRLFRKKVEVFITVCRGLGEKMAVSSGGGGQGAGVEQLLLRLDLTGFYGKRAGG